MSALLIKITRRAGAKEHESGGKKVFFVGAQMSTDDYVLARDEPSIHRGIKY